MPGPTDYYDQAATAMGGSPSGGTVRGFMQSANLGPNPFNFGDWMSGGSVDSNYQDYRHQGQIDSAIQQGLGQGPRVAPQVGLDGPFRNGQMTQIGQLQGIASGQQQGAGELATGRQVQNALAAQFAGARMARGGNSGLAQLGAAQNNAGIGLAGAGQAQQAALQDQTAAQGLLSQSLGQARGQDSQIQLANMDAKLRQMGMDDQMRLEYLKQLTGMDQAQLQMALQQKQANQQQAGSMLQAGGGAMAMMSDERTKTDITDAGDEIDEMLSALAPKRYTYKDQAKHGEGSRIGIMSQDLRRSKAGADVTIDTTDGIAVDVHKALSASLAANARLHERLSKLERKAG